MTASTDCEEIMWCFCSWLLSQGDDTHFVRFELQIPHVKRQNCLTFKWEDGGGFLPASVFVDLAAVRSACVGSELQKKRFVKKMELREIAERDFCAWSSCWKSWCVNISMKCNFVVMKENMQMPMHFEYNSGPQNIALLAVLWVSFVSICVLLFGGLRSVQGPGSFPCPCFSSGIDPYLRGSASWPNNASVPGFTLIYLSAVWCSNGKNLFTPFSCHIAQNNAFRKCCPAFRSQSERLRKVWLWQISYSYRKVLAKGSLLSDPRPQRQFEDLLSKTFLQLCDHLRSLAKTVECVRIMVEWVPVQLLSQPKVSKSHCVISQSWTIFVQCENPVLACGVSLQMRSRRTKKAREPSTVWSPQRPQEVWPNAPPGYATRVVVGVGQRRKLGSGGIVWRTKKRNWSVSAGAVDVSTARCAHN